jgi:predicted metal-dependent hydrolase
MDQHEHLHYTVRTSKRARYMRLAVYCDGAVVLTAPVGVEPSVIKRFFEEKKWWVLKKIGAFRSAGLTLVRIQRAGDYRNRKNEARALVLSRVEYYNNTLGVSYNSVRIKNQKRCWGSCSKKRNININYRILHLPKELQDYIIVHELCHLKEFSHSKRFWSYVEAVLPNYRELRANLKRLRFSYQ